jgi:hypothetical protein
MAAVYRSARLAKRRYGTAPRIRLCEGLTGQNRAKAGGAAPRGARCPLRPLGGSLATRRAQQWERDFSSIDAAFLVGDTPFENVRPLWPSDHAGVVATVDVPEPPAGMLLLTALLRLGLQQFRTRSEGGTGASLGRF